MKAMILEKPGQPLKLVQRPDPQPGPGQVQVAISACGVCRTDLHVVDGDLTEPRLPIIPGHEIVGTISALGTGVDNFTLGERIGIPWLGHTCGCCSYCASGAEKPVRRTGIYRLPDRWRLRRHDRCRCAFLLPAAR